MSPGELRRPRLRPQRVVGWSGVLAGTLGLAAVFQALAASALAGPTPTAPAASADGDDVRARLVAARPDATCDLIVGQPLYAGQNSWVPQRDWQCADPLP